LIDLKNKTLSPPRTLPRELTVLPQKSYLDLRGSLRGDEKEKRAEEGRENGKERKEGNGEEKYQCADCLAAVFRRNF